MSAFSAAIRPTVRDVRRHPWRTIAAIVLIALPIAFLCHYSIRNSSHSSYFNALAMKNSATFVGGTCEQSSSAWNFDCGNGDKSEQSLRLADVEQALDGRFTVEVNASGFATITAGEHQASVSVEQLPPSLPLPGAAQLGPNQIMLNEYDAKGLQVSAGDTVEVTTAEKTTSLTVTSIVPMYSNYVSPGVLAVSDTISNQDEETSLSFIGDEPMTWADVKTLNKLGLVVDSADVAKNPPAPADRYPAFADAEVNEEQFHQADHLAGLGFFIMIAIFYGLVITVGLQVIAPIFALSSSRQSAIYSLMRSQGASKRHIRLAVLTYGTIAGLFGATLGIISGAVFSLWRWRATFPDWPPSWNLWHLAGYWVIGVLAATAAAFIPAVIAANAPIMAGVEGAQPDRLRHWRRWMAVGPIAAVVLFLAAVALRYLQPLEWVSTQYGMEAEAGQQWLYDVLIVVVPLTWFVIIIGGIVAATASIPALMYAIGTIRAPLAARLAGRMARRQALKSSAIVAALIGIVGIGTTINVHFSSVQHRDQAVSSASFHGGSAMINYWDFQRSAATIPPAEAIADAANEDSVPESVRTLAEQVRGELGATTMKISPVYNLVIPEGISAGNVRLDDECYDESNTDRSHCEYHDITYSIDYFPSALGNTTLLATDHLLEVFSMDTQGRALAERQLAAGGGLVSKLYRNADGHTDTARFLSEDWQYNNTVTKPAQDYPVAPVLNPLLDSLVLSQALAEDLHTEAALDGYLVTYTNADGQPAEINAWQQRSIKRLVADSSTNLHFTSLITPTHWFSMPALVIGVILLVILGLILVLSAQSVRRSNEQLYALGAPDRLLRAVGAWYSGLLAAVGTVVPLIIGHLVGVLTLSTNGRTPSGATEGYGSLHYFTVDWFWVLILGVAVPLIAAVMGYVASRPLGQLVSYRQD